MRVLIGLFSIIRPNPTFTLSPSSLTFNCGTTQTKTFTVSTLNSISCSTSYLWSLGANNGWLYNGNPAPASITTPTNSITLTSENGNILPSTVKVTPIVNGINYSQVSCITSFNTFTSTAFVFGNSNICTGALKTYTITNLGTGNTVSWSSSNTSIATVSNGTQSQVSVNAIANGSVTLIATITNACGQTDSKTKTIWIGSPTNLQANYITGGYDNISIGQINTFNINPVSGATSYQWNVIQLSSNSSNTNCQLPTVTNNGTSATVNWGNCVGKYEINVQALNQCGSKGVDYKIINLFTNSGGGNPCPKASMQLITNQLKSNNIEISIIYPPCDITDPNSRKTISNVVDIYNIYGNKIYTNNFETNEIIIQDIKLSRGYYIMNILTEKGQTLRKKIVIE